jgi:hypothetical protein
MESPNKETLEKNGTKIQIIEIWGAFILKKTKRIFPPLIAWMWLGLLISQAGNHYVLC